MLEFGGSGPSNLPITHNLGSNNTLRIVRSNAGAHFNGSDLVVGKSNPAIFMQLEDASSRNRILNEANGAGLDLFINANSWRSGGVWARGNTTSAAPSLSIQMTPAGEQINFLFATSGTGTPTFGTRFRVSPPATGEWSLWLYDGSTNTLKRVKLGAAGTGPGGVGKAVYVDN